MLWKPTSQPATWVHRHGEESRIGDRGGGGRGAGRTHLFLAVNYVAIDDASLSRQERRGGGAMPSYMAVQQSVRVCPSHPYNARTEHGGFSLA